MSKKSKQWDAIVPEIEYLSYGDKNAPPLLFLHGFGGNPNFYKPMFEILSQSYYVLAPRIYGQNYLSKQPYAFSEYLRLTMGFIRAKELKNYSVAGHSYGGLMSMFLGKFGQNVKKIVSLSPMLTADNLLPGIAHFGNQVIRDIQRNDERSESYNLLRNMNIPWTYLENFVKNPFAFGVGALLANAADLSRINIKQPAVMYHAEHDLLFNFGQDARKTLEAKNKKLQIEILEGYGHNWVIYHPEFAAKIITDFVG